MDENKSLVQRFLTGLETAGNKLPNPAFLFMILAVIILIVSAIGSSLGLSAVNPSSGETIEVVNLLSR